MLTDSGLCQTLNGQAIGRLFKPSEYMEEIKANLMDKDFYGNESASVEEGGLISIQGAGAMNRIRIVLDAQEIGIRSVS